MTRPPLDLSCYDRVRALRCDGYCLELLDQRLLPFETRWHRYTRASEVAGAIADLVVRGAPAIGIAAAYGVALEARALVHSPSAHGALAEALVVLGRARPTAVNLHWALARMRQGIESGADAAQLLAEARAIEAEDLAANRAIATHGWPLLEPGAVLTICNTGSLATAGIGTALGIIRAGVACGRVSRVYALETRPWLQGARLTAWELNEDGIDVRLIADSAAASVLAQGLARTVVVGADRVCANGDSANKIGTYMLAIAARAHRARFIVAAPWSTVDLATADGHAIEIEQRPGEVLEMRGVRTAAPGVVDYNPVFDVTPAALIDALVTERGVIRVRSGERPDGG